MFQGVHFVSATAVKPVVYFGTHADMSECSYGGGMPVAVTTEQALAMLRGEVGSAEKHRFVNLWAHG